MHGKRATEIETPPPFDFDVASVELTTAMMLAIGALAVTRSSLLNRVAQGLHDSRPLVAALIALGHAHRDELEKRMSDERERRP